MDWTVIGGAVGTLALIGVAFQIRSNVRDHPKRQLEYTVKSKRLVQSTPQASLEIRANGVEVPDPYLVEFRLKSNSRADIPTSAFDAGHALKIRIQPGGMLALDEGFTGEIHAGGMHGEGWDWAEFEIPPQLVRKGSTLALDFISGGSPHLAITSPLIDVPVLDVTQRPKRTDLAFVVGFFLFVLVGFLGVVIGPPLFSLETFEFSGGYWFVVVVYAILLAFASIGLYVTARWRRPRRSN